MEINFKKFKCIDRLFVTEVAEEAPRSSTLTTSTGSDTRMKVALVKIGTDSIPAGSYVLVRPSGLGAPIQYGKETASVITLSQVEAVLLEDHPEGADPNWVVFVNSPMPDGVSHRIKGGVLKQLCDGKPVSKKSLFGTTAAGSICDACTDRI